jgi:hypothetical protein
VLRDEALVRSAGRPRGRPAAVHDLRVLRGDGRGRRAGLSAQPRHASSSRDTAAVSAPGFVQSISAHPTIENARPIVVSGNNLFVS